ncbi:MAG: hypothetical protein KDD82_11020 [Planctomycetes bacterium]|nr:hypothetical protein [Planctomycetota bacterium]
MLALLWAWLNHLRSLRSAIVERILTPVEGEVTRARMLSDTVRGRHDGRPFLLRLGTKVKYTLFARSFERGWRFLYPLEVEVELACAPPIELCVRRVYPVPRMQPDEDPHAPEGFMRRHLVEGAADFDPLHTAREARVSLANLLGRCGLEEVRLSEGRLRATGRLRRVGPQELNAILAELEVLAREFDRRPAIEIGIAERYVWVGSGDHRARCAYCHDDLGQDALASCVRCHTLTHTDCYTEHGGCPILGCGGHQAAPVPSLKHELGAGLDLRADFGSAPGPPPEVPGAGSAPEVASRGGLDLDPELALPRGPAEEALPELALPPEALAESGPGADAEPALALPPELPADALGVAEELGPAAEDLPELALPPEPLDVEGEPRRPPEQAPPLR